MITPAKLQVIRTDLNKALQDVAKRHSLSSLTVGKMTYTDSSFRAQLEAVESGGLSREASLYESQRAFDKKLPKLGTEFTSNGRKFRVSGMTPRGKILATDVHDGKEFRFNLNPFY